MLAPTGALLVVVGQSTQAVVKLLGGKVKGTIRERLKSRQGLREQENILMAAVFLDQVFCGIFQGIKSRSVIGAQVTSWDGLRKWFHLGD